MDVRTVLQKKNKLISFNKELNKWDYGVLVNGSIYTKEEDIDDAFMHNKYRTIPVKMMSKYRVGVCWDFVNYEADWLEKNGYEFNAYYIYLNSITQESHTFIIVHLDDQYYYMESSWGQYQGVKPFKSERDALNYVIKNHRTFVESNSNYTTKYKIYCYRYNPHGLDNKLDANQYMNHISTTGTKIRISNNDEVISESTYLNEGLFKKKKSRTYDLSDRAEMFSKALSITKSKLPSLFKSNGNITNKTHDKEMYNAWINGDDNEIILYYASYNTMCKGMTQDEEMEKVWNPLSDVIDNINKEITKNNYSVEQGDTGKDISICLVQKQTVVESYIEESASGFLKMHLNDILTKGKSKAEVKNRIKQMEKKYGEEGSKEYNKKDMLNSLITVCFGAIPSISVTGASILGGPLGGPVIGMTVGLTGLYLSGLLHEKKLRVYDKAALLKHTKAKVEKRIKPLEDAIKKEKDANLKKELEKRLKDAKATVAYCDKELHKIKRAKNGDKDSSSNDDDLLAGLDIDLDVNFDDWSLDESSIEIPVIETKINKQDVKPVFLICVEGNSGTSKIIKSYTHSIYSHSGISLTSDLSKIYSFCMNNKEYNLNGESGFSIESIDGYIDDYNDGRLLVFAIFLKNSDFDKLEKSIEEVMSNPNSKYGVTNLIHIVLNVPKLTLAYQKMVCSQFVDFVLKAINLDLTGKYSNLVTPQNIADIQNPKVYKIFEGKTVDYDPVVMRRKINSLSNRAEYIKESTVNYIPITESGNADNFFFYHVIDNDIDISENGLVSLDYMYKHKMFNEFDRYTEKYRERICNGWNIYPDKTPDKLSRKEIYDALLQFRGANGTKYIYLFKFPPYVDLDIYFKELYRYKSIYRVDLNNPELRKIIDEIDWGYENSNSDNRRLDERYYQNISVKKYFDNYDSNLDLPFASLHHIAISTKTGNIPYKFLEKVNIPNSIRDITESDSIIQFNDDGDLLIKNPKEIDFKSEHANSKKLFNSYKKHKNESGLKYEACKLWYMNIILLKKIEKEKNKKKKEELTDMRAKVMNEFSLYIDTINELDSNFNFSEYYQSTPFGTESIKITGSTIKYSKEYLKLIFK